MSMERDEEETTVTLTQSIDTFMDRLKRGEPDRELQQQDRAFRRGYLQGWSEAIDTIFARLLDMGVSVDDAYRAVARIENEVIMPWRNTLDGDHTPCYRLSDFLKPTEDAS